MLPADAMPAGGRLPGSGRIRVLALIPPIERHVGHWACPSPSIDLVRLLMEGDHCGRRVAAAAEEHRPQVIAIVGKEPSAYLDFLDGLSSSPLLRDPPRIYRCQNTALLHRAGGATDRRSLADKSEWFARACDRRLSMVLVQTWDDADLIRSALAPVRVVACPYGYDASVFDPSLPDLDRDVDVGCYLTLKDDPRRVRLVEVAREICARRGWTFRFISGRYWHRYAEQIRTTKVCLHQSRFQEIPFRMYETMALGSLFATDPLRYGVERFFERDSEYLTFEPGLSDLEAVLESVIEDPQRWEAIRRRGRARAARYRWTEVAEEYVAPALHELLEGRG